MRRLVHTNRLLWLGASAGALPLRGSGCRNLALPGVCEQALPTFNNNRNRGTIIPYNGEK
jgi:hypothetical protein